MNGMDVAGLKRPIPSPSNADIEPKSRFGLSMLGRLPERKMSFFPSPLKSPTATTVVTGSTKKFTAGAKLNGSQVTEVAEGSAIAIGEPFDVSAEAGESELEAARKNLEDRLALLEERARAMLDS